MLKIIPPIREQDAWGAGYFRAPRGSRLHNGVDFSCFAGSKVLSFCMGSVTKFGRPYYIANAQTEKDKIKNAMRYVEVKNDDGLRFRYFYVLPSTKLSIGNRVQEGDILGKVQHIASAYPGMTNHYHFEVMTEDDEYLDPMGFV